MLMRGGALLLPHFSVGCYSITVVVFIVKIFQVMLGKQSGSSEVVIDRGATESANCARITSRGLAGTKSR